MVRAPVFVLAVALLVGCSGERQPITSKEDADKPVAQSPAAGSAQPAPHAQHGSPVSGSGLTGQVSSLNSAVSGLNIRVTDYGTVIDLPADALFEFDRADLTPGATEQLTKSVQVIRSAPVGTIRVIGHTDNKGDDAYNQKLSEARAQTVASWFGRQVGVRQRQFEVSGMGEKQPVASNETAAGKDEPAGRARNRRVEVVLPSQP